MNSEGDELLEITPSQWLINSYKIGIPLEDIKKRIRENTEMTDDAIHLGCYLVEKFYKKWDKENGRVN